MSEPRTDSKNAQRSLYLAPILTLAALLRLWVVWISVHAHPARWFFDQASELGCLATSMLAGRGFGSPFGGDTGPSAFLEPGYPAVVALAFRIFEPYSAGAEIAIMVLQGVFGMATVAVLVLLTRKLLGRRVAIAAGIVWAINPLSVWLPAMFWETSLSLLLLLTIMLLANRLSTASSRGAWIVFAMLAAICVTINPSLLLTMIGIGAWAACCGSALSWKEPAAAAILLVMLMTPWAVRNQVQLHAFIPLRSNMGYELWQGNRPGSDGLFLDTLHPNHSATEFARYQQLGEVSYMREKSALAKVPIKADPAHFLRLTLKRMLFFWTGRSRQSSPLIVGYLSLTTLLGLCGLVQCVRRMRMTGVFLLIPLALFPMPYYITHPDFRFRIVIDPLMIALGAWFLLSRGRQESPIEWS